MTKNKKKLKFFENITHKAIEFTGSTTALMIAMSIILVWMITGPLFNYSDTWQLIINTGTTIITFLMVFLIQRAQNKDSKALHMKLNELIASINGPSNRLVDVENIPENDLEILHKFYSTLAEMASNESDLSESHSIDEAKQRHEEKVSSKNKIKNIVKPLGIIIAMALFTSCNNSGDPIKSHSYGDATKELIELVNNDTKLKSLLVSSIQKAKEINPDTVSNPAQSLVMYFAFISKVETSMPWTYIQNSKINSTFEQISQSLSYFYFVIDQPLSELEGKDLYHNSIQYYEPFAKWLTRFNKSWQKHLESEKSWNKDYYELLAKDPAFGLRKGWYEEPSNWKTFNQFFARYLSSVSARPIASPNDNSVVVSYADAVPQGVWAIDSNSTIVEKEGVTVKSANIKNITKLLGENSQYNNAFKNGTFIHSFLNVNDYHRFHFAMGGTIKEVRIIQSTNPIGGVITWNNSENRYDFNPSSVDWQMLETRGCVILETEDYGLVALLPIGMAAVGSVNFEKKIKVGEKVKKGDMLGYFLFGGSDFIMIFQDKVTFTIDAPKKNNSNLYKHQLMGEKLGHLTIK